MRAITIESIINAPIKKVWECWTNPEHITKWNQASDDWHCPFAENDIRTNGKFKSTMASKDGKISFDFEGIYDNVIKYKHIAYSLADGRKVTVDFIEDGNLTKVIETFNPENVNSEEMQKAGWQMILDNFKKHTETTS